MFEFGEAAGGEDPECDEETCDGGQECGDEVELSGGYKNEVEDKDRSCGRQPEVKKDFAGCTEIRPFVD